MKPVVSAIDSLKGLCRKYPAVVLGYFLVGYSFIALVRLFIRAQRGILIVEDLFDVFSALPFMWLLALSIVQIIHDRSNLRQMQKELELEQLQRQITESQLSALKESENSLRHSINTPLAIISLSLSRLRRAVSVDRNLTDGANDIECASKQIGSVLSNFWKSKLGS